MDYALRLERWWIELVGTFAALAVVLIGLGLMVGILKPGKAFQYAAAFFGIALVLILLVTVSVGLWWSMSLWQRVVCVGIAIGFVLAKRSHKRKSDSRRGEEQ